MTVRPSSIITEYNLSGSVWVDISAYVTSDINCRTGFSSTNPYDFTASLGRSTFDLDNSGGLFTVYGGDSSRGLNTLSGWNKGTKIRHRVKYLSFDEIVWLGFVQEIVSDDGVWGNQKVHVTCTDWMDAASRYPMKQSQILTDRNLGQGLQSIIERISKAPEGFISGTYSTTFEAIFDNVKSRTKASSEMDKLARSEMGYVYVTKDGYLKAEGETTRKGTNSLFQIPSEPSNALMASSDTAIMVADTNVMLIDGINVPNFAESAESLDLSMREEFWNDVYVKAYPTRTDTSSVVLFQIGSAIPIMAGVPIELIGNYTDPNGGSPVNGAEMVTPVATTDYQMFAGSDGSGADLTANLTVTATYYGDVVHYRLLSSYATGLGYITKLQARGKGVYRNSSLEGHFYITGSASEYGEKTIELNQTYQTVPYAGMSYVAGVAELYKTPKTRVFEATYSANLNYDHMVAFLKLDIGNLIRVYDNRSGMYKWYHITYKKFALLLGGMIILSLGLMEHPSLASGGLNLTPVDFGGYSSGDAIDYGYLPHVAGDEVTEYTIATWIYLRSVDPNFTTIFNLYSSGGANTYVLFEGTAGDVKLYLQTFRWSGGNAAWRMPTNAFVTGTWAHVAITYSLNSTTSDPKMYLNGVSQTVTEVTPPSGNLLSSEGARLVLGNTGQYANGLNGILKDVRFYDRILTADEIATLYNNGVMDTSVVTDDLVFQGPCINSDLGDANSLNGLPIPSGNNFLDNILRRVGEPRGTPLIVNQ